MDCMTDTPDLLRERADHHADEALAVYYTARAERSQLIES